MNRLLVMAAVLCSLTATGASAKMEITDAMRLKDAEGNTYAVIIDCLARQGLGGSERGNVGPDRCGKCLIDANWGTLIRYPYDLTIEGSVLDENGDPKKSQLVHLFLPNGWTIKTRTTSKGHFRMVLGATDERKSEQPLKMDVGTKRMKKDSKLPYYALFMMPLDFKPCEALEK